jgi:alpha-ketoglutarate-dependent taurine dioxygenase
VENEARTACHDKNPSSGARNMSGLICEAITPNLGARVLNPAEQILDTGIPGQILEALNRFGVLHFPEIFISDQQLVALTNALGDMKAATVTADGSGPSEMGIYRIAADKTDRNHQDYVKGNNYWHMDGTSYATPGKGTLLKCESPPSRGGETDFANLFAAWNALPAARQQALEDLRVLHCLEAVGRKLYPQPTPEDLARWDAVFPPTEQPLVWKQRDGRTSLVIGSTASGIVGMSPEDGSALLQELLQWCTRDEFTYRHHWQRGDLVIFNNPGLLHRSRPYDEASGRVMHRTTLEGHEAFTSARG